MRPIISVSVILVFALAVGACAESDGSRAVIDEGRKAHGSAILDTASVSFGFRGDSYIVSRAGGLYEYTRRYADSARSIEDVMTNDSTFRMIDGMPVAIDDSTRRSIESRVNSVVYFALLPYNLADDAVRSRLLEPATIGGEPYDVVEVTFAQDGGGRDWEDVYVYWFHRERRTMDYLAYSFNDDDGGGSRFREAMNPRTIGGVRFQDYRNFTIDTLRHDLRRYPDFLGTTTLDLVSVVEIEDISVH